MRSNICPTCNGGKKCPHCQGKGYKVKKVSILATTPWKLELTGRDYEMKRIVCPVCSGDGLCSECHGNGFIDSPNSKQTV